MTYLTNSELSAKELTVLKGYLSAKKDRLVSNSRLSRAAIESGLDAFIITKAFTGHKWRPPYIDDLLEERDEKKRQISTKVLADVVEALIGAAMVDEGIPKALACLRVFLPKQDWQPLESRRSFLYQCAPKVEARLPGMGKSRRVPSRDIVSRCVRQYLSPECTTDTDSEKICWKN